MAVASALELLARPYADEITRDALGNLLVHKKGPGKTVLLSAHMDTLGLMVTHIEESGFLRCAKLGGVDPQRVPDTAVVFPNGTRGVVSCEPSAERGKLKFEELFIDVGASSWAEAQELAQVGDVAVYEAKTFAQNGKLFSTYLDDRIGCCILLHTLARLDSPKHDLWFLFSAQEEVGCRGAGPAAFRVKPNYALSVDVTGAGDLPESKAKSVAPLGVGAGIKLADRNLIAHPRAVRWLEEAARRHGIPFTRVATELGGTDAGPLQTAAGGAVTGAVCLPTRYVHGALEVADLGDIDACVNLLAAALDSEL
jgi:endoglucanase